MHRIMLDVTLRSVVSVELTDEQLKELEARSDELPKFPGPETVDLVEDITGNDLTDQIMAAVDIWESEWYYPDDE